MGVKIKIVPTHDHKWYTRSNTASAILSLAIAAYYGVFEFIATNSTNDSGINFQLAVFAAAHALYGLTLFFALSAHHPKLSGFISYLLFFIVSSYSFWISKDANSVFFSVLVVAGLLSGLYGWIIATLFNSSVITLLIMMQTGDISSSGDFSTLNVVIYVVVSIMSVLIWSSALSEDESNQSSAQGIVSKHIHKKTPGATSANLSTNILIDSITDGVAIIDKQGTIGTFNPAATKITGWSQSEAIGLDHKSVMVLADQQDRIYGDQQNPITSVLKSGEPKTDNNSKLQTRSKKLIDVDLQISPIKDGKKITSSILIFRDVSKQRSEERQRAEFISTASHEMRTPVAAIEGYLALAMNEKVSKIDSSAMGYLQKAHASTQHLGKLFQDLLTAAKSEDGRLTNNPTVVEVGQLLDELIEGARFTAENKGLIMEADLGQDSQAGVMQATNEMTKIRPVVYVYVDPERVREVITNLFDNAVKYTEEGKITIGMHIEDNSVTIRVQDTGAGIPKEDIPHLFQKFYRVDNSATRQIGGTGLGLFISRKIVELYNGRIWVESNIGEGSSFFISFPRLSNEKAQELMRIEEQKKSPLGQGANTPGAQVTPNQNPTNQESASQSSNINTQAAPVGPQIPAQPIDANNANDQSL